MRRILCIVLIILMTVGMSSAAFADTGEQTIEVSKMSKEERDALALEIFPEFEHDIMCLDYNPNTSMMKTYDGGRNEVVYTETRAFGDNLFATIVKWANGITNIIFEARGRITDSTLGTGYAHRVVTYNIHCALSNQLLVIEDIEYTLVQNGYDAIADVGTPDPYIGPDTILNEYKMLEDSAGPAYILYTGYFEMNDIWPDNSYSDFMPVIVVVEITVGNDQSNITLY